MSASQLPGGQVGNDRSVQGETDQKPSADATSIEGHADPLFLAPGDMTGQVQPGGLEHQREILGDAYGATYLERRSDIRHVANHAIDRAAVELDRSGPQDAVAWEGPLFVHGDGLYAHFLSKWLKQENYIDLRSSPGTWLKPLVSHSGGQ
jgi:hypothetical protein